MEFSDGSSLPYLLRPVLDALLALNIDLSLDAVAIRFGFWDWGKGLLSQYFGVPYANFWAWFWVIFFFSLGYRLFARRKDLTGTWISPLSAPVIGLVGILGTNALMAYRIPFAYHGWTVVLLIELALAILLALRPTFYVRPVPSLTVWVPFITHAYILIAGLVAGHILNPPFLLGAGLAMLAIAFVLHGRTLRDVLTSLKLCKRLSAA
jgi:hypothetical protein